jgi:hypothetical protein
MEKKETENHKKLANLSIGNSDRKVGLSATSRIKARRTVLSSLSRIVKSKNTGSRTSTTKSKGCKGCSRSSRK